MTGVSPAAVTGELDERVRLPGICVTSRRGRASVELAAGAT